MRMHGVSKDGSQDKGVDLEGGANFPARGP
jgi:hypothetical protein